MDSITMKNMGAVKFENLNDDVNVHFIVYVSECEEYGNDPQFAWDKANQ